MGKKIINDPKILFNRWYKTPLTELEKIPDGDGGFVVLAVSCFLYERYVRNFLKNKKLNPVHRLRMERISIDFNTDKNTAEKFWDVIRNGLLHHGTPKQKDKGKMLPGWVIYDEDIPFKLSDDSKILFVNIWKFRDRVFELYNKNPDLIGYDDDYPWGHIWYQK